MLSCYVIIDFGEIYMFFSSSLVSVHDIFIVKLFLFNQIGLNYFCFYPKQEDCSKELCLVRKKYIYI